MGGRPVPLTAWFPGGHINVQLVQTDLWSPGLSPASKQKALPLAPAPGEEIRDDLWLAQSLAAERPTDHRHQSPLAALQMFSWCPWLCDPSCRSRLSCSFPHTSAKLGPLLPGESSPCPSRQLNIPNKTLPSLHCHWQPQTVTVLSFTAART